MTDGRLELAALVRLGLAAKAASLPPGAARPGESLVDALVRVGALRPGQAIAVRAFVDQNAIPCGACGERSLAPPSSGTFTCPSCSSPLRRESPEERKASPLPAPPKVGAKVGPLELVDLLGKGAYGTVFKARHAQLDRFSALKVVPGAALDRGLRARFEREVVAQARLDHPNIVRIHATYELQGALACEMDWIEGDTLAARIQKDGPLPWREAASIVAKVARAIEHAHGRGVLHRDLKPANVLLRKSDGEPLVVDLGLARFLDQASSLTRAGAVPGTPLYVAPEVLRGETGPLVDVYALGAVLYEALTGHAPFEEEATLGALFYKIARGEVAPVVRRDAPPDLERVRARAMEIEPAQRYASPGHLANDLERVLRGEPIAGARGLRAALGRPGARARLAIATAAVAGGVLVGGALLVRPATPPRPDDPGRARSLVDRARQATDRALARRLLADALAERSPDAEVAALGADAALALDDAALAAAFVDAARGTQPALVRARARVLRAQGKRADALALVNGLGMDVDAGIIAVGLLLDLGRAEDALERARVLPALAERAQLARALVALGDARRATKALPAALVAYRRAVAADARDATAARGLALVSRELGIEEDAPAVTARAARRLVLLADEAPVERRAALVDEARRLAEAATRATPQDPSPWASLAWAALIAGDARGATAASDRALELAPRDPFALLARARALLALGDPAGAARAIDEVGAGPDAELRASGLASPPLEVARLEHVRAEIALAASDGAGALEHAHAALAAASTREERRAALLDLARASELAGRARDAERHRLDAERLLPDRAEARAIAREDQSNDVLATEDAAVESEPWEPARRVVRQRSYERVGDYVHAVLDECTAAAQDPRYVLRLLHVFFWAESREAVNKGLGRDVVGAKLIEGVAKEALEVLFIDPERVVLLEGKRPPERVATRLARAMLALVEGRPGDPDEPVRRAALALAFARAAQDVRPGSAGALLVEAIALERLGAVRSAERARRRLAVLVPDDVHAAFLAFRSAWLLRDEKGSRRLIEDARAQQADARRRSGMLLSLDATGVNLVLERLVPPRVELGPPPIATPSVASHVPAELARECRGWSVEELDGEAVACADPDGEMLELRVEGDVVEAEVVVGQGCGRLVVECGGERFEHVLGMPGRLERHHIVLAAGLPGGPKVLRLGGRGRVLVPIVYDVKVATSEDAARDRATLERCLDRVMGRPADLALVAELVRKKTAVVDAVWSVAASTEFWSDAGARPGAFVDRAFERLLGRAPTADERARWIDRLERGADRAALTRALARSAASRRLLGS